MKVLISILVLKDIFVVRYIPVQDVIKPEACSFERICYDITIAALAHCSLTFIFLKP